MNDTQDNIINPYKRWCMRQYKIKVTKSLALVNRPNIISLNLVSHPIPLSVRSNLLVRMCIMIFKFINQIFEEMT